MTAQITVFLHVTQCSLVGRFQHCYLIALKMETVSCKAVFPNVFSCGRLLASKNNHGSSHPCSRKCRVSGRQVCKIRYLYLRTDFTLLRIHTSSICNNALKGCTIIKMIVARFVGTRGFLIRYSNDHTK